MRLQVTGRYIATAAVQALADAAHEARMAEKDYAKAAPLDARYNALIDARKAVWAAFDAAETETGEVKP